MSGLLRLRAQHKTLLAYSATRMGCGDSGGAWGGAATGFWAVGMIPVRVAAGWGAVLVCGTVTGNT